MSSAIQNPARLLNGLYLLCTSVISCGSNVGLAGEKAIVLSEFCLTFILIYESDHCKKSVREKEGRKKSVKERKSDTRSPNCFLKEGGDQTRICEDKTCGFISSFLLHTPRALFQHVNLQWVP